MHKPNIYFNCRLCNFKAKNQRFVSRHYNSEHDVDKVDKRCKICDFEAQDVDMIEQHVIDNHVDEVDKKECHQCNFSAHHEPLLEEHMSIHEGNNCELCSFRGSSRKILLIHINQKHGRQQMKCTSCNFSSASNPELRKHAKTAHGIAYEHVCDSCGKDYPKKCELDHHKLSSHSGLKGVKCHLCTFETKYNTLITKHWNWIHKSVSIELKCQHCDFEPPNLSDLETKFKHQDSQLAVLEAHLKEEHKAELGNCDDCQFSAYHEATLDFHKKTMHNLKCDLCNYEGASTKHIRTHIDKAHMQRDPLKIEKKEPL